MYVYVEWKMNYVQGCSSCLCAFSCPYLCTHARKGGGRFGEKERNCWDGRNHSGGCPIWVESHGMNLALPPPDVKHLRQVRGETISRIQSAKTAALCGFSLYVISCSPLLWLRSTPTLFSATWFRENSGKSSRTSKRVRAVQDVWVYLSRLQVASSSACHQPFVENFE